MITGRVPLLLLAGVPVVPFLPSPWPGALAVVAIPLALAAADLLTAAPLRRLTVSRDGARVVWLGETATVRLTVTDIFDHFLGHQFIAPYLEGGELLEYGCHLVAEGGLHMIGRSEERRVGKECKL